MALPTVCELDDEMHDRLIAATDGAMSACFQCGTCTATCPWGLVREEHLGVRQLVRSAQLGVPGAADQLWLCTACGACESACPRAVGIVDSIRAMRAVLWERREAPEALVATVWNCYEENNPTGEPKSRLSKWASGLDLPLPDSENVTTLLHVGSAVATDQSMWGVGRGLSQILTLAGVTHTVLGDDELFDGELLQSVGERAWLSTIQQEMSALLEANGLTDIICISPHAVSAFRSHPAHGVSFNAWHYLDVIPELLEAGRLAFSGAGLEERVAYHDPCLVGRGSGLYNEPRQLLDEFNNNRMEFAENSESGLCCGGGNGRMWLETDAGERFGDLRLNEAVAEEIQKVVTTCPFCVQMLQDSTRAVDGATAVQVAELITEMLPYLQAGQQAETQTNISTILEAKK